MRAHRIISQSYAGTMLRALCILAGGLALAVGSMAASASTPTQATLLNPQNNENISKDITPSTYTFNGTCLNADQVTVTLSDSSGNIKTYAAKVKGEVWESVLDTSTLTAGTYTVTVTPSLNGKQNPGGFVDFLGNAASAVTVNVVSGASTGLPSGGISVLPSSIVPHIFIGGTPGRLPIRLQAVASNLNGINRKIKTAQVALIDNSGNQISSQRYTFDTSHVNDDPADATTGIPASIDLSNLPDGLYSIQVQYLDDQTPAGVSPVFSRRVIVDSANPVFLDKYGKQIPPGQPLEPPVYPPGKIEIFGHVQDLPSGNNAASISSGIASVEVIVSFTPDNPQEPTINLRLPATLIYGPRPQDPTEWVLTMTAPTQSDGKTLVSGTFTAYVIVTDNAGNTSRGNLNPFKYNGQQVQVTFSTPTPGQYVSGVVHISGQIIDQNQTSWSLYWNKIDPAHLLATGGGQGTYNFVYDWNTVALKSPDGAYTLFIVATDQLGGVGSDLRQITLSNLPPNIQLTQIGTWSYDPSAKAWTGPLSKTVSLPLPVGGTQVAITGTVTDLIPTAWQLFVDKASAPLATGKTSTTSTISQVSATWNTEQQTATNPPTYVYANGQHTIYLWAKDALGNPEQIQVPVWVANQTNFAQLTLSQPSAVDEYGSPTPATTQKVDVTPRYVKGTGLNVQATVGYDTTWTLQENNQLVKSSFYQAFQAGQVYQGSVPGVVEGQNLLTLQDVGLDGQTSIASLNVVVDNTPPKEILELPAAGTIVPPGGLLSVVFQVDNNTGATSRSPIQRIIINGQPIEAPAGNGKSDFTLTIKDDQGQTVGTYSLVQAIHNPDLTGKPHSNGAATIFGNKDSGYTVNWQIPIVPNLGYGPNQTYHVLLDTASDVVGNTATSQSGTFQVGN